MLNAFQIQDKEHFVSYGQVLKKKKKTTRKPTVLFSETYSYQVRGSAPCSVGGFLQSMYVEQFHFYVLYIWERRDSDVFGMCVSLPWLQ